MGGRLQSEFSSFLLLSIYIKLVSFQPVNLQLGCGITSILQHKTHHVQGISRVTSRQNPACK